MDRAVDLCEALITRIFLIIAMTLLPTLIGLRVWEIFARNVLDSGSQWYDFAESEALALLVFLSLAYGYVCNSHVRVDVLSTRWSRRTRAWVELIGAIVLVAPFVAVIVYYGLERVYDIAELGERSALLAGMRLGWLVHASLPVGIGLFGFAVLLGAIRNARFLLAGAGTPVAAVSASSDAVPTSRDIDGHR